MHKQRGLTLISWVLVLGLIAFFSTIVIRLLPMYQEYFGVLQVMDSMTTEIENNQLTQQQVYLLLFKKFDSGYIDSIKEKNVKILRGKNSAYVTKIVIDYEVRKPFMFQIDLIGHFHTEIDTESGKK